MLLSKIIDKLNGISNLNEESLELKAENQYNKISEFIFRIQLYNKK
jgi:hypothetical protein